MVSPAETARVAARCPCGAAPTADSGGIVYWHKATGRAFCGPACGLRWYETFWRPYCAHAGRDVATGEQR